MRRIPVIVIGTLALAALWSCREVPSEIIQPDDMASLMADMRMAGAVVSVSPVDWRNEEAKEALKRAVLDKHGVSEAEFDSSLMWYGHHIKLYQDMTDHSVEILRERLDGVGSTNSQSAIVFIEGDSSDIWPGSTYYRFDGHSPSDYITFSIAVEGGKGDIYSWRARLAIPPAEAVWSMTAEYSDGSVETVHTPMSYNNPGTQRINLYTDTTRELRHVSGWMRVRGTSDQLIVVDSVALTRRNYDPSIRGRRMQRFISSPIKDQSDE